MALWPLRINASFLVPCVIMARLPGIRRNLNAFLDTIAAAYDAHANVVSLLIDKDLSALFAGAEPSGSLSPKIG